MLQPETRLGYLVFEVRRPARWARFCRDMLALQPPLNNEDGSCGWQIDGLAQRLIVQEGPADDLCAIGWQVANDAVLDRTVERLQQAAIEVSTGSERLRRSRRVRRLLLCKDPCGNLVELFTDPERADRPFASSQFPGGFETDRLGLGHVVLVSRDLAQMEAFYCGALGFGVTERLAARVGPIDFRGVFLHCNQRHHSLALFDLPLRKRIHHFMLQGRRTSDIGKAFERARSARVPLSLGLGQHPDSDGTISFYGATPSGFDFEIGAGSQTIDVENWQLINADVTSTWGHQPRLRLQLKMAAELFIDKLKNGRSKATTS